MPRFRPLVERFMEKIHFNLTTGCWLWMAGINPKTGYGQIRVKYPDGRFMPKTAHQVAYELFIGPVPEGKILDHVICDMRKCANPFHLEPSTHKKNILRGTGYSARNARKTHCPKGHPYSGDNLNRNQKANGGRGSRTCRACKAAYDKRRRDNLNHHN